MAKIKIAGDAAVVTSALKLSDIQTVEKYRPKALTLYGGEEGKTPLFVVGTTAKGSGSINEYGAVFNGESHDGEGFATLTVSILDRPKDVCVKDWIADKLGGAIINLNALEEQLPAVLTEIAEQKERVVSGIEVLA